MNSLDNYVKIYEDVIPDHYCRYLIERFEENKQHWEHVDKRGYPKFKLFYVKGMEDDSLDWVVRDRLKSIYDRYRKEVSASFLPQKINLSEPKIKKYNRGSDDRYDKHVDITTASDSKRYAAFLIYLNDIDKGGSTVFDCIGPVKPKQGRCIIFPPNWLYPHAGLRTISHDKYIMSAYGLYE
jgi:hypothetical protein